MKMLLESMRKRMSFAVSKGILKYHDLPTGHGWDGTLEKYIEIADFSKKAALRNSLREHNLCGNKYTKFYETSNAQADAIRTQLQSLPFKTEEEGNVYLSAYPNSLPVSILDELDKELFLVEKISNDHGIGAVFASTTKFTKREQIFLGHLVEASPEATELLTQYQEVVGLKYQSVQLFSVIWVSHGSSIVETRIDLQDGMRTDVAHLMHSKLKVMLNNWLESPIRNPIDLYPLINKMYKDKEEGHVVELAFSTTTASVKREKMRRVSLDLRQEVYHEAGKAALDTEIEPYSVSIRWMQDFSEGKQKVTTNPELTLAATSKGSASKGTKFDISAAEIKGCMGTADYHFVIDRIRHHLSEIPGQESSA